MRVEDQTRSVEILFDAPMGAEAERETEALTVRLPRQMARDIDEVVERARARKLCQNRHRFLKWALYVGIVRAAEILQDPEINDSITLLQGQVERQLRAEGFLRHRKALDGLCKTVDDYAKQGMWDNAEWELKEAVKRARALQNKEWREKFLAVLLPKVTDLKIQKAKVVPPEGEK